MSLNLIPINLPFSVIIWKLLVSNLQQSDVLTIAYDGENLLASKYGFAFTKLLRTV